MLQTNAIPIPYVLRPTRGLEDLYEAATEELAKGVRNNSSNSEELFTIVQIKCLFLLNCGGGIDLAEFLDLNEDSECTIYVLDSHRPYNVKNIHHPRVRNFEFLLGLLISPFQIALIDDGTLNMEDVPKEEEVRSAEGEDSEEEDDEDEGEGGDQSDELARKAREQAKRQKRLERLLRKTYKTQIEPRYYVPSGTCSAGLIYEIASQVGHPGNELLWAAIVGLTDQWLHGRISYEKVSIPRELN